jgi:hypothetical protein
LYKDYLPVHHPRKSREIAEIYRSISDEPIPDGRYYMIVEIIGEVIDKGWDFAVPKIKYVFKNRDD